MKFSEFKNIAEMLKYFGLGVHSKEFINFETISPVAIPDHLKEDIRFVLSQRGDTDMEFYACEALIFPILKEAWKRNPKAKLFSHPQIKYEDLILVPDYVVAPTNKTGVNIFQKPLLVTAEAKNDDYDLGLANANQLLGVLDFIFADCVRTAEKFDMY